MMPSNKHEPRAYWLYRDDGLRAIVSPDVPPGALILAGPVTADSRTQAKIMLTEEVMRRRAPVRLKPQRQTEPGIFKSAHEAMTFAFRFAGQQSPKTPMSVMLQQAEPLGSGRGLVGLDGAGQAGMLLASLHLLKPEQRHVIIARYGDIRRPCPCCGQPAPDQAWLESVEALSRAPEIIDLPKQVRHAAIEKAVCRRKLRFQDYATEYGLSARTLRHKLREVRERYAAVENQALAWLDDHFEGRGVLAREN